MPNKVRDWMSSPAIVIDPDSSVSFALTLMRRRNIHSIVVDLTRSGSGFALSRPQISAIRSLALIVIPQKPACERS